VPANIMSKMDHNHPLVAWCRARKIPIYKVSEHLKKSPMCVHRYVRGERSPSDIDRARIAAFTTDPATGEVGVPVSVWHDQALARRMEAA